MSDGARAGNITVWRSGAVGDFVLTLPALDALRRYGTGCPMRLVGRPSICQLVEAAAVVDSESPQLLPLHARAHCDERIAAFFADCSLLLAYGKAEGPLYEHARGALGERAIFWDPHPIPGDRRHITDHLLAPLRERLAIEVTDPRPTLAVTASQRARAAKMGPIPAVLAHPGSSAAGKCWPLERYIAWAQALRRKHIDVGFISGPIEREQGLAIPDDIPHFCPADLRTLAALLAQARLFVGNDSGPGHIAAAVGTPTLSLFGPTDPLIWAPRREASRILVAEKGHLANLPLETVVDATLDML